MLVLLGALEGFGRFAGPPAPSLERAEYLWDWEEHWDGDFYTLSSASPGWPPGDEINRDGLRDRMHATDKLPGVARVVFLGDSVTFGAGTEAHEAYPQVLQARLDEQGQAIEVFNVGLWGWSTRQQRIAYQRIVRPYAPDRVVVAVCLNDIPEMQNNLNRPPRLVTWLYRHSAFVRWMVDAPGREIQSVEQLFFEAESARVEEGFALFFDELRELRRSVSHDGGTLGIVVFPFRFQVVETAPAPVAQNRIVQFCAEEGIACLDLLPTIREQGESAFVDYDHLSPAGARLVAEALQNSALLPDILTAESILQLGGVTESHDALTAALRAGEAGQRAAAAWALGHAGEAAAVVELAERLARDENALVRWRSARALGALGRSGDAYGIPALLAALEDRAQAVRWAAADALHEIGLKPGEGVPALARAVNSQDDYMRAFATWTLGEMGDAAAAAVPVLADSFRGDGGAGRAGAAAALAKIGAAAGAAVPVLVAELRHQKQERRWRAARTLGRLGPSASAAVDDLIVALGDSEPEVRAQVARALGRIGVGARAAIPALTLALKDEDEDVRLRALDALGRIPGH
jgi:HEAT repeat protein